VLIALALQFIVVRVTNDLPSLRAELAAYPLWALASCSGVFLLAFWIEGLLWRRMILDLHGAKLDLATGRALRIFAISNLGKYIPGRIWMFALQSSLLAEDRATPMATGVVNALLALYGALSAIWVAAACVAASRSPILARVSAASLALSIAAFPFLPLREPLSRLGGRLLPDTVRLERELERSGSRLAILAGTWIIHGLGAVILVHARLPAGTASIDDDLRVILGMTASWLVGAIALYAPAGLGVREVVFYVSLSALPESMRIALPVLTRGCLLATEGLAFIAALAWTAIAHRRSGVGGESEAGAGRTQVGTGENSGDA
jgi:hypothetical protein